MAATESLLDVQDPRLVPDGWMPRVLKELQRIEIRPASWLGSNVFVLDLTRLPTGSFKSMPAFAAVWQARAEGYSEVVIPSAGNFAAGGAWGGSVLGVPVTTVMPEGTDPVRVNNCRRHGAEVIIHGEDVGDAFEYAKYLAGNDGRVKQLHPFDREIVLQANAMIGYVAAALWARRYGSDAPMPAEVLMACGGGGLLAGFTRSLGDAWPGCRVIGVEPDDAASLSAAQSAGGPVKLPNIGIWSSASVPEMGSLTYGPLADTTVLTVGSRAAILAARVARDCGLPIELAAALPFAAVTSVGYRPAKAGPILVVASGCNDTYARD